jgi:serine/threonine protein kinase
MKTEQVTNRCPKCQVPLPANAPQGLCAKCLLAAVATPTEAGQPSEKDPPPPIAVVAEAFPQLEMIELIGQGGMGFVYKVRQPKLDRLVALKLLPQALAADAAFAERFNREARVLARLNHPSIVAVHDFGQAGGFFYLLMEFVDGVNLRQAMQAGRFTPQQAMSLVPRICEALQFAHDEGILHRDIKPENILLDTRGRVKIADFGIAKLLGEAREKLVLTASGMAVGTPHYMAPEQLEHPDEVDQRADIYSLGVVFYEMLTGELPIGRFAAPSEKSAVDSRVDDVVFHALEKEREKRFRTATEVKTSVEAISSTSLPSAEANAASSKLPAEPLSPSGVETHAVCYFNTPQKMSDCFPSASARVFTCRGELVLASNSLTFISPWRTTIRIPLQDIEDLSVGQFQMWTTPWVMKFARLNFLSVAFRSEGKLQTVHLTPVPPDAVSAGQINLYVGRWFERIQQAVHQCAGTAPHTSEPEWLSVSAEPAWNRKGLPLTFGFALTSLAAWVLMPQSKIPAPIGLSLFLMSMLFLIGLLWFCAGFLQANRAVWRGDLDAVTSDEPPTAEHGGRAGTVPVPNRSRRFRLLNLSTLGVIMAGLALPLGLLLWEAWLYPAFGERFFGKRSGPVSTAECVIDTISDGNGATVSYQLAAARHRLSELQRLLRDQHPAVQQQIREIERLEKTSPGSERDTQTTLAPGRWQFKCLVPADQLAQVLFVRWTNGMPIVEPGFSAYFKTGHAPADIDFSISCEPQAESAGSSVTNRLWWNVNLGLGVTAANLLPAQSTFQILDPPARMIVHSGHQRVIRLAGYPERQGGPLPRESGVELRVLLEPLKSPAMRTVPSEKELNNCIGGSGLELPMEKTLKLIKQLRCDP